MRPIKLALLIVLACAAAAHADDRTDIKAVHAKLAEALRKNDYVAMRKLEAPGFYAQEAAKKVNAVQFEAQMKQRAAMTRGAATGSIKVSNIKLKGITAQVVSIYRLEGPVSTPPGARPGPMHTFGMTGSMFTTLIKSSQGWRLASMNQQFGTPLMDGRPFNAGPPPVGRPPR